MTIRPTDEQIIARDAFTTGGSVVIEAGAGAGKTQTLVFLAQSTERRGQFVAFNRSIVQDSGPRFPSTVAARTMHSLAFAAVGKRYADRLNSGRRMRSEDIARVLRIDPIDVSTGAGSDKRRLAPGWLAGRVMEAVGRFCQSADDVPGPRHFAYVDGLDLPDANGKRTYTVNNEISRYLSPHLTRAWMDLCQLRGQLRFEHSTYLKLSQLGGMVIPADFILTDEAQDISPVMHSIIESQDAQRIWVGDSAQCQPAGTRVRVATVPGRPGTPTTYVERPIEDVQPGDRVLSFNVPTSFLRRSGSVVRRVASRPYNGEVVELTAAHHSSVYTPNHRCVVRVGDALVGRWLVYLMRRGESYRVGMVAGTYLSQHGHLGLPRRMAAEGADAAWILSMHRSESEARAAEMWTAFDYGLPTVRFRQGTNSGITQADLDAFWDKVGPLGGRAEACLMAHGRRLEYPLCAAGRRLYRSRSQVMEACNVLPGMLVLTAEGAYAADGKRAHKNRWSLADVRRTWYSGVVYSLDIENDATYVADGIVTHNSIYGWTGAVNSLAKIAADHTCYLTLSFRFGQPIADVANRLLAQLDTPLRLRGLDSIDSEVITEKGEDIDPDCILARTNACSVRHVLTQRLAGRSVHLIGEGKEVLAFARAAEQLQENGHTTHRELSCFQDWPAVQAYVQSDAMGGELRLMVQLVDEFGVRTIEKALAHMPREADAEIVVSTAHKFKGREARRVKLADDFPVATAERALEPEEIRLQYVAVTRAKNVLDLSACPTLAAMVNGDASA